MYHLGGKTEVPLGDCLTNPLCLCMVRAHSMFYKFISQGGEQISSTALGTSVCGWLWKGWLMSQRRWPFFFIVFYYYSEQNFLQLYFFILEVIYLLPWSQMMYPLFGCGLHGDMQQTGQSGWFMSLHRYKEPYLGPNWDPNSGLWTNRPQCVLGWEALGRH